MTIRLLRAAPIAIDGIRVRWYREGDILNVPDDLGTALVRDGLGSDQLAPDVAEKAPAKPAAQPKASRTAHQPKQQYKEK